MQIEWTRQGVVSVVLRAVKDEGAAACLFCDAMSNKDIGRIRISKQTPVWTIQ